MEMCLHLIRARLKEVQLRLDLLGIEVKQIQVELWPDHSPDTRISLWNGNNHIKGLSHRAFMAITEFDEWYKHKQILFRDFSKERR